MIKKRKNGLILLILIVLALVIYQGPLSIFGDEFSEDSVITYSLNFNPPNSQLVRNQNFETTLIGQRSFLFPENSINLSFSGTQGSSGQTTSSMIWANSNAVRYDPNDIYYAKFGLIPWTADTDDPWIFNDCCGGTTTGHNMISDDYCNINYGDTCFQVSGYYTFINGEKKERILDLDTWSRNWNSVTTSAQSFNFSLQIDPNDILPYYNTIEIRFHSPNGDIPIALFEVYVEPQECTSTELILRQTAIGAGNTISLDPNTNELSFPQPDGQIGVDENVVFCHLNPVQQISNTGTQLDFFPLDSLTNGGTITVPDNEVWIFSWRAPPSGTTITLCPDGSIYDPTLNACVVSPTVEYVCSDGVFDEGRLACVVQPESEVICVDPRAIYIQEDDICRILIEGVTSTCSGEIIEEDGLFYCLIEPEIEIVCNDGSYNENSGFCEVFPDVVPTCEQGSTYNPEKMVCEVDFPVELPEINVSTIILVFILIALLVIK